MVLAVAGALTAGTAGYQAGAGRPTPEQRRALRALAEQVDARERGLPADVPGACARLLDSFDLPDTGDTGVQP